MSRLIPPGLSRRAVLTGGASLLALPWLPSLRPARADDAVPTRLLFYFVPNGLRMDEWTPEGLGPGYTPSPLLEVLQPHLGSIVPVTGLRNLAAYGDPPGDHATGAGTLLTGRAIASSGLRAAESIDQRIAATVGRGVPLRSLHLGVERAEASTFCDGPYSCTYNQTLSWADAHTPIATWSSPRVAFDRLFGEVDAAWSEAERADRARYRRSVLDAVAADAGRLQRSLGAADRQRLEGYLTGIRELELKIDLLGRSPQVDAQPPPEGEDSQTRADAMTGLMVLALQADLSRVGTFLLGNAGSNRNFSFVGAPGSHHDTSHHGQQPDKLAALSLINRWELEQLSAMLTAMEAVAEGDGTLLDHTIVVLVSEVSDGQTHSHHELPVLLAGRGAGLQTGQHLRFDDRPLADLHQTLMAAMGVPVTPFWDATGVLSGLFRGV